MQRPFDVRAILFALAALALSGCPGNVVEQADEVRQQAQAASDFQGQMAQLRSLGAAYHRHIDTGKPPAGWQDLKESSASDPALQALEDAGCVVAWGKTFRDAPAGASEFVLAYLPATLQNGGAVLVLDGAVVNLSAAELQQKLAAQNAPAP